MHTRFLTCALLLVVLAASFGVANTTAYGPYQQKPLEWAYDPGLINPEFRELTGSKTLHLPMWKGGGAPRDISGNENHATLPGGGADPTWITGSDGPVMEFVAASSQYLSLGTSSVFDVKHLTVIARAKFDDVTANHFLVSRAQGGSPFGWSFRINGNTKLDFAVATAVAQYLTEARVPDTKMHTFIGTYDGETSILYEDGVELARNTTPSGDLFVPTAELTIGRSQSFGRYFDGSISFVAVLPKALTANEVAKISAYPYGDITPDYLSFPELIPSIEEVVAPSTQNAYVYWW